MGPKNSANNIVAAYELKSFFRGQFLSYLVGFYVFAFYMDLHLRIPALETVRFQFTYGAIIGGLCLLKLMSASEDRTGLNSVTKVALLLIFICGIYTIFSFDRAESIRVFSDRVVKFSLMAFFIYAAVDKIEDLWVIIAFMLLAWLKMGQEGFWGWYTGGLVWENQGIPRLHGSTGKYGHPNSFSGFAVGCLPFTIFLLACVKSNLLRLGLLAIFACSIIIVVTTGSRTGYVAVVLGAFYFFAKLKTNKFKIVMLAILTFSATIAFVPEAYKERFESIFTGEEKEGASSDARIQIVKDAAQVYAKYPLGVGVAAFPQVRSRMFNKAADTHNLYLEILTNLGPFGLLIFGVFIYKILDLNRKNLKVLHSRNPSLSNRFLIAISKATIGFVLVRLLLGMFGMDLYEIYWWLALGLTLAITKLVHRDNPARYPEPDAAPSDAPFSSPARS